jgi:hypothetical protein
MSEVDRALLVGQREQVDQWMAEIDAGVYAACDRLVAYNSHGSRRDHWWVL